MIAPLAGKYLTFFSVVNWLEKNTTHRNFYAIMRCSATWLGLIRDKLLSVDWLVLDVT